MTPQGLQQLKHTLHHLETQKRAKIIQAICEARAHGDLKENQEYKAAKEEQALNEGRIAYLKMKLAHSVVIDVTQVPNHGKIVFGATVQLICIETQEIQVWQIVGEDEAAPEQRLLSVAAPLARALIGKSAGDVVEVQTPDGLKTFEVDEVKYI